MKIAFTKKIIANIELDAREWQLYSDMDGVDKAAEELNRAIEAAIANATSPYDAFRQFCLVANKLQNFGAIDTEPRAVAEYILEKAFGQEI